MLESAVAYEDLPAAAVAARKSRLTGNPFRMAYSGGVDLGGTKIQVVVTDGSEVAGQSRRPTPTQGSPKDVANEIAGALRDAATEAGVETSELEGSASARPARSTTTRAPWRAPRTSPGGTAATTCGARSKACGAPVSLGNDVQVATDAEFALGSGRDYSSLLGVFWGTGVGGGIVLDGRPWIGRDAAGEIGHIVVRRGGALCGCGRRGCMEAYAGRGLDGGARSQARVPRREDGAVQDHGGARPHALTSGVWSRALDKATRSRDG